MVPFAATCDKNLLKVETITINYMLNTCAERTVSPL
ncbi:uncharacterized protein METZ01_LOCUS434010, partial [marine metagenome]